MNSLTWKYGLAAGLMLWGIAAFGASLDFAHVPARDAAAQITEKYGVNIVFRGTLDTSSPVTFSVAEGDGARMQAVISLANAMNADCQKTYVVSKADKDVEISTPKIDTNAIVAFPSRTVTADEAVQRIAGVDSAISQFYGQPGEMVTLSATSLDAREAARQVAQQTHTRWKVFFAITPAAQGRTRGGRIVGRTSTGEPIIQDPYVYYHSTPVEAPPTLPSAPLPTAAGTQVSGQSQAPGYGSMPYGFYSSPYNYPYGFDSYAGNNPYSQNLYAGGYGPSAPVSVGSGLEIGGGGYGSPIIFGGGF